MTAYIPDNQVYPGLTFFSSSSSSSLSSEIIKKAHFMVADPGYDDHDLYESSLKTGFQLVCPVQDTGKRLKKSSSNDHYELVILYKQCFFLTP